MRPDLSILNAPITFDDRPVAVAGPDRVQWRLASVVLVLNRCRGKQTSVAVLHVLVWSLSSARTRANFLAWWSGRRTVQTSTFRFDPIVDRTVDIAIGAGLVTVKTSGKIQLTDEGQQLASAILESGELMTVEKEFLTNLPTSISESEVERRLGWGGELLQ